MMLPTHLKVSRHCDPRFAEVAVSIAKGEPPEWLLPGLTFFSGFIYDANRIPKSTPRQTKRTLDQMDRAAELLIKKLPMLFPTTLGIELPQDVAIALVVLPHIRERIARGLAKRDKSPEEKRDKASMMSPDTCAAVVTEAWERIHGKVEARSDYLYKTCRQYWIACGHEQYEESIDNWRYRVEKVAGGDRLVVKAVFDALSNPVNIQPPID
jgi:hypothetical protein